MWRSPLTIPGSDVPAEDFIGRAGRYRLDNVGVGEKQMQYCPNCMIQIRGRKARCPLCQRELMDPDSWTEPESQRHPIEKTPEAVSAPADSEGKNPEAVFIAAGDDEKNPDPNLTLQEPPYDDDPFVRLPSPKVSFMLKVRAVTFICISLEILLGAAQIISGGSGWFLAAMLFVLLGWVDFRIAVYYRSNPIRMLTTQGYIIMAACLILAHISKTGSWAVTWVVPFMFCLLIAVTFIAARAQKMELHEYILYPAFDVLMSLLQIIPIVLGINPIVAPAVICIAIMLILVSGLIIFRGRMLREAAEKYLHI